MTVEDPASVTAGDPGQPPAVDTRRASDPWWKAAVVYQVYPRYFADSDGDGVGDLRGVIDRLDHLEWLGVAGIWLNPTMPSPNEDWGYDVADFTAVHPELGTMEIGRAHV